MLKIIRLSSVMFLFCFALLVTEQVIEAEEIIDGFVDELFEKDKSPQPPTLEQPLGEKEEPNEEVKESDPLLSNNEVGLNFRDFLQMLVALAFVVFLLYATLKFINKRSQSYKSSQLIENLGGTNLGANRSAQIVKVGNRILVVGVGENIQLLTEITDEAECAQIIQDYNEKMDNLVQPNDVFSKMFEKINRKAAEEKQPNEFQLMLNNELKEMRKGRKELYSEIEKKGTDER